MTITVIEPDRSIWLADIKADKLGEPFYRAEKIPWSAVVDFENRLDPAFIRNPVFSYHGVLLRSRRGEDFWIYVRDDC